MSTARYLPLKTKRLPAATPMILYLSITFLISSASPAPPPPARTSPGWPPPSQRIPPSRLRWMSPPARSASPGKPFPPRSAPPLAMPSSTAAGTRSGNCSRDFPPCRPSQPARLTSPPERSGERLAEVGHDVADRLRG